MGKKFTSKLYQNWKIYFVVFCLASPIGSKPTVNLIDEYYEDFFFGEDTSLNELHQSQEPEVSPGLYEGDIAGLTPELLIRLGLNWETFPERRWDNGTVPYSISYKYLPDEREVIQRSISTLNFFTCINFIPWDGKAKDYLLIWPMDKPKGCWSFVGKIGGQQVVSLQRPDRDSVRCLGTLGKPIHELLHALGTFHEQARSDRDKYIYINLKNVHPKRQHNFKKQSQENSTFTFPYDYESVMHYGTHFFSKDRKSPTILPKKRGVKIGQRIMLSKGDCLKVNDLYGCLDRDPFEADKYRAFCNYLAI